MEMEWDVVNIMNLIQDKNDFFWKEFFQHGTAFYKRVMNSIQKPDVFTPEILYNLISMSIEKYLMAYLLFHNILPDNHTFSDFVNSIRRIEDPGEEFVRNMEFMDSFQEICGFDLYKRQKPSQEDIEKMLEILKKIQFFVSRKIKTEVS